MHSNIIYNLNTTRNDKIVEKDKIKEILKELKID